MAGKPGRSGGARPGAGRKPRAPIIIDVQPEVIPNGDGIDSAPEDDPKAFLLGVMHNSAIDAKLRLDAAKALLPYVHQKVGEVGKKEERAEAAKKAGGGKFASAAPPLRVVGGKS